ncbi:MAG TPA: hypothetical protein VFJ46_17720 [Xanthobacteraceae bacterium]|nr:hypothetical protein [Xanthobacteraceae bacterium]
MIARGEVPVGAPVDKKGAATADLSVMVGIAGRQSYKQHVYADGERFPLVKDTECLIQLVGNGEVAIGGVSYKLLASENHYARIENGKIVSIQGKGRA